MFLIPPRQSDSETNSDIKKRVRQPYHTLHQWEEGKEKSVSKITEVVVLAWM